MNEPELSSPACSIREADDSYMGYAGREELISVLNELLEAERAICAVRDDEARWCAMLSRQIEALGAASRLHEKAIAIPDLGDRLAVLNRKQDWVMKKLRQSLPRVQDDRLHADLTEMLRSHEAAVKAR